MLSDERGFTLVELLVTALIGLAVLAAVGMLLVASMTSSAKVQDRTESAQRARLSLDRAAALLQAQVCNKTTAPIVAASPTAVTFSANLGDFDDPVVGYRLSYDGSSDTLNEQQSSIDATGAWAGLGASKQLVDRSVPEVAAGGADLPVFRYYAWDPLAQSATEPTDATKKGEFIEIPEGDLPAKLGKIVRVDIRLRVLPTRTQTLDDRTSTLLKSSAFITSSIDQEKLEDGPKCT